MEKDYIQLREHHTYPNFKSNKNIIQVVIIEYCTLSKKLEVISNQKLKCNNNDTYTSCNIKDNDINYVNQIKIGKIYVNNTFFNFQKSRLDLKLRVILPLSYYNNELPIKFEYYEWDNYMKDSIQDYLKSLQNKILETIKDSDIGRISNGFFIFIKESIAIKIQKKQLFYKDVLDKIEISKCKYEIKVKNISEKYHDILSSDNQIFQVNDLNNIDYNDIEKILSININNERYIILFSNNEHLTDTELKIKIVSKIIEKSK